MKYKKLVILILISLMIQNKMFAQTQSSVMYNKANKDFQANLVFQGEYMCNNRGDYLFGYGLQSVFLFKNGWFRNEKNHTDFLVAGVKLASFPEKGGKLFGFYDHGKSESFNYIDVMGGYHFGLSKENPNWYAQPKIGLLFRGRDHVGFSYNPAVGYDFKKCSLDLFYDGSIGLKSRALSALGIGFGLKL